MNFGALCSKARIAVGLWARLLVVLFPDPEGIVTVEAIPARRLTWKELYLVAMLEPDSNKSPSLLDDAINAVLDQIEETCSHRELEELNNALNGLRSHRKQVCASTGARIQRPDPTKAA
jgi:hypothetical protein